MFRRLPYLIFIVTTSLTLASFRMPVKNDAGEKLLYDVRGAFVTARPDVPKSLVIATDMLVDEAIRSTTRSTLLPRTIISVRIEQAAHVSLLIGSRHEARVTVQAVAVGSGEPIAEGSFTTSIYLFDNGDADRLLAEKIADRVATEFRLDGPRHGTLASALSE